MDSPLPAITNLTRSTKAGIGFSIKPETVQTINAWICPPTFRHRGEVLDEMVRVLKATDWKPGYDGLAFLEAKKEAAPVSTPRAAPKLKHPKAKR